MSSVVTVEIDRPQAQVAALLADPTKQQSWMDDLKGYKLLSGKLGEPGSVARLTFKNGKRTMVFEATITDKDLPRSISSTLDSPMMRIVAIGRFETMSPGKTKYTSEQEFQFKGIFKLLGFLVQGAIRRQQLHHAQNFKEFAEKRK